MQVGVFLKRLRAMMTTDNQAIQAIFLEQGYSGIFSVIGERRWTQAPKVVNNEWVLAYKVDARAYYVRKKWVQYFWL